MRWFPDEMPMPAANAETLGWWEAAQRRELVVQRCSECGATRHPPGPLCPACHSPNSEWSPLPGTGTVYTYTVVRQAFIPALADALPYVVAAIELDDANGARMVSNVVEIPAEKVTIGLRVEVAWEQMGEQLSIPRFRPIGVAS
jgi:uncharacterized OB-fold protein